MYTPMTIAFSISLLSVFANAVPQSEDFRDQTLDRETHDWATQKIDKPALQTGLEYLDKGLFENLPTVAYEAREWLPEYIPQWCLDQSNNEDHGFDPAKDIKIYDIRYNDCEMPDSEAGDGDIVFENLSSDDVATIIHEVGHSLDKFAYDEQLSFSSDWREKTNKDKSVPNDYAGTSAIEDVAESSIIATYNMLVPGGYPSIESRWEEVRN
ncbi:MAG: hypothetical protein L6R38_004705 [Xanthoria sp. 2 TBL-2021]|nr:MAG: hypothetical protein L6R38_004705 [Xanthoria sp. 2 TBL-2021]